jgi:hypothetical protein
VRRAISRIEARGKGILLLHDIHKMTVLALPQLLNELKARDYRIVHVVEANAELPKTASLPEQWIARQEYPGYSPHAELARLAAKRSSRPQIHRPRSAREKPPGTRRMPISQAARHCAARSPI